MKRLSFILVLLGLGAPFLCAQMPGPPPTPREVVTRPFHRPDPRALRTQCLATVTAPLPVAPTNVIARQSLFVVDVRGHDANSGLASAPLRTLQRAAQLAQPGDTVAVRPGVYAGFRTVRSGRAGQPITFLAQGEVVINVPDSTVEDLICVRGTDWITVSGFTVRDAPRAGISVIDASHCVISNNVCGPNKVWGIFTGFAPLVQIVGNKAFGSGEQHGIYVSNSRGADDKPVIRGNECYANAASGIQLNGDCNMGGDGVIEGALIEGNVLHDNESKAFSLISIADSVIQNNLVYNNGRKSGAGGIHLTDEKGCGKPSRRNVVVNNTIAEPRIAAIRMSDDATDNVVFNNLMLGGGIADETGKNQVDGDSNFQLPASGVVFVSPERGDYRLLPGAALPAGKASYAARNAPTTDFSGTVRRGLMPSPGACDAGCTELPVPGRFDAVADRAWKSR